MTIKSGKQCISAHKRMHDVNELKQWMINVSRGLHQINEAPTSVWRKRLRACVCTRDGRFEHLL